MKQKKRGRGRPKKGPIDLAAARSVVAETLRKRQAERDAEAALPLPKAAEVIEEASLVTRKHRYTKEEMEDLRMKLDYVYNKYIQETWEAEAEANRELNQKLYEKALNSPPPPAQKKLMTEEEWHLAHGLRADGSKRRGPAPKPRKKYGTFHLEKQEQRSIHQNQWTSTQWKQSLKHKCLSVTSKSSATNY